MGMHMASHNMAVNPSPSLDMNMNPSGNMSMNLSMGPSNMPMNLANSTPNPAYLAMLNAQQNSNSMNGMMAKFPYPSYSNQSQQQGQQSMGLPHSQMPNMGSQLHSSHNPSNTAAIQNAGQSISPTQLMSASPSQFMSGPSSQQQQSHSHPLNLTPAQLLQQQQSGAINPASLAGGPSNMNMGGLNPNLGSMGSGMSLGVNMGGLGNVQNMANAGNANMQGMPAMGSTGVVPNPRMNVPPNVNAIRYAQITPHERQAFQRQHAASLGHGLPSDRGLSATPSQSGHERGPSLTHERPPAQHERSQSLTHERQPSQQPHERAPSQPHDPTGLPGERPSSSASVRSHHSHHNLDAVAPHGMMGPPGSRPGTASGMMPQLTRMNSINLNSAMGPMHMSSGTATNLNPNMNAMNAHLNSSASMMSQMNQPPHMNAGVAMNPQMTQMGVAGGMGMAMNRPPTRTGSAMGSPKQSPRMSLNVGGPTHMGMAGGVGMGSGMTPAFGSVTSGSGMIAMNTSVQGNMAPGIGGGMGNSMGGGMTSGMGGVVSGPMNTGLGMGMNAQGMSGVPSMPGMGGMSNMGPMNMNAAGPSGLGGGGMMGGATAGLMGPPVIPPTMQRPEREQMMQAQVREQSAPLQREASLPPSSSGSFIGQNLESTAVPNIPVLGSSIPSNLAIPRQPSQPPVHPHQQSPLRKLLPGQSSNTPIRKANEMVPSTNASSATGPSVHGAPEGHKLPPHLAALNPAVTKITYIPYKATKTSESTDGAEDDKKSDDGSSQPEGDESKEGKKAPVKIEDPVSILTPSEISTLKEVMAHDAAYEVIYRAKQNRMLHEMRTAGPASRLAWWDRDFAPHMGINRRPDRFDVRYPRLPKNDGNVPRRKGARREGIRIPRRLPSELADRPEQLVPIRLEFDVEHHKMRDTFLWNLNDPVITPEMFAQTLVEDYSLLPTYHSVIVKSIQEQLSDFKAHMVDVDWKPPSSAIETTQSEDLKIEELDGSGLEDKVDCGTVDAIERVPGNECESLVIGKGTLDEEEVRWWESWRKRCRKEAFSRSSTLSSRRKKRKVVTGAASNSEVSITKDNSAPRTVDEFELDEKKMHEDLRILIKLDIIVGSVKLDDQFEWDLENEDASPEQFAEVYAKELGLGGEFQTAISHCIREQVHVYQKSLFLVGHPGDGSPVQDEDLRMAFLPSLASGTRSIDQVQSYTPTLNYMSDGEIERSEKEREKELARRRKRNTRGRRGIALPDREPNRTYRTPAIGFPELDAATLALAAAANAPTSRRAAAAAATLTIANMVASENGMPIMPAPMPQQQPTPMVTATPGKEKRPKGLFKPPQCPPSVIRPRAHVSAPTPSTAVESTSMLPPSLLDKEPPPPVVNPPPPDSKTAAKKAREAEREAKEKELADGQHANVINGVWHCSNCGCPESIAIGRRKGPLGDKSQCGTCGKFWHRHRRLRPVQYNSDPQYHLSLRNEAEQTKTSTKKRGRAPNSATVAEGNETPSRQKSEAEVPPPVTSTVLPSEEDRPVSPVTSASSGDEAPLAQQSLKANGTSQQPATSSRPGTPDSPRQQPDTQLTPPGEPRSGSAAPHSNGSTALPPWLTVAMHDLQDKYPDDKFEAILRKPTPKAVPEWRIKCLDCPGKLYNPGPGDTLSNYEVHLRNRQHRSRVNNRVNGSFA